MAISIDWANQLITIPRADLTLISGTLYELDTNWFRLQLKALESGADGIPWPRTHDHVAGYTVAGVTYTRKVEMLNGYRVQFEDGQYSVRLAGSNNNIFDVGAGILVQNQVQVIAQNSAGFVNYEDQRIQDIHSAHWNRRVHDKAANTITIYSSDGVTPLKVFNATDDLTEISPQ